ncbi:hypothetical protein BBO_05960 [Beauveria brongniartii RCEF 3172]|uniref:Uncharacterized protein n=1 Tax=Beauveria brongniartii RCEF 3172 TaxID=1081107 RepID=A0A167BSU8_9HYPO|nr:hypothetical protein BBO_05960 [Beauveria brongniartii RCEF 3172]
MAVLPGRWPLHLLFLPLFAVLIQGQMYTTGTTTSTGTTYQNNLTFLGVFGGLQRFPVNNPVYKVGGQVTISWETVYDTVDIWLGQMYPDTPSGSPQLQVGITSGTYTWHPTLDNFPSSLGKGQGAILYFQAYEGGSRGSPTQSRSFNLTLPDDFSATSGEPSATPTPSPGNTSSGSNAGLSGAAIAGIAVGATLGAALLALCAGLAFCGWRRRQKRYGAYGDMDSEAKSKFESKQSSAMELYAEALGDVPPVELSCDGEIRPELDAATTMRFPPPPPPPPPEASTTHQTEMTKAHPNPWTRWFRRIRQSPRKR